VPLGESNSEPIPRTIDTVVASDRQIRLDPFRLFPASRGRLDRLTYTDSAPLLETWSVSGALSCAPGVGKPESSSDYYKFGST
jgi:hypothetical protein